MEAGWTKETVGLIDNIPYIELFRLNFSSVDAVEFTLILNPENSFDDNGYVKDSEHPLCNMNIFNSPEIFMKIKYSPIHKRFFRTHIR